MAKLPHRLIAVASIVVALLAWALAAYRDYKSLSWSHDSPSEIASAETALAEFGNAVGAVLHPVEEGEGASGRSEALRRRSQFGGEPLLDEQLDYLWERLRMHPAITALSPINKLVVDVRGLAYFEERPSFIEEGHWRYRDNSDYIRWEVAGQGKLLTRAAFTVQALLIAVALGVVAYAALSLSVLIRRFARSSPKRFLRSLAVVSAIWMICVIVFSRAKLDQDEILQVLLAVGLLPLVLIWGAIWIRRA